MAEKMFELKHRISESKLLALISAHAEEVSVDIYVPERKTRQPRLTNGRDQPQLLLEAPTEKQARGPYKKGALGTSALMLQLLNQNRTRVVSMKEIIAHAAAHNVSAGAVSVAATKLLKEQAIERVGIGQYKILKDGIARASKELGAESEPVAPKTKHAPAPKTKSPGVGRGNYPRGNATGGGRKLIWAELVKGEPVHSQPFREMFRGLGLSHKSVSSAFDNFIHRGLVTRIEEGVFQITEKGKEHHAAKS